MVVWRQSWRCRWANRPGGNVGRVGHAQHGSVVRMPDRPRNGGPEDGPDFTWLYGKGGKPEDPQATRPVPREQRPSTPGPDETQVMRAQPGSRHQERRATPPTPPRPAPPVGPPQPMQSGRKRRRFRMRYVLIVLLLWLVYIVAVPLIAWNRRRQGRVRAGRRSAGRPAGHDVPPGRQRLARGSVEGGAQGAQHGQRRRWPDRHDHAAAHRLGTQPPDVHPPRPRGRDPRPRHIEDQRRLRGRRSEAARRDRRGPHRHPGRPVRRDRDGRRGRASSTRSAASRSARTRRWSTRTPG